MPKRTDGQPDGTSYSAPASGREPLRGRDLSMARRRRLSSRVLSVAALLLVGACHGNESRVGDAPQIFIEFKQRPDPVALQSLATSHGLTLTKLLPSSGIAVFAITDRRDPATHLQQLRGEPGVKNAELDQRMWRQEKP